jgi:predicted RNase H-like HicB family nuclease
MAASLGYPNFRFGSAELQESVTKRYLAIYRRGPGNLSGFVPDVPGCSSIGHSMIEMRENLHDALEFHLEDLMMKGAPLPEPSMGLDDVVATGVAEWMVVKLWLGGDKRPPLQTVRPCPER